MKISKSMNEIFLVDEILKFSFCPRLWHIIFISGYFQNKKTDFSFYILNKKKSLYLNLLGLFMVIFGMIIIILDIL